jgi:hypothetical protein
VFSSSIPIGLEDLESRQCSHKRVSESCYYPYDCGDFFIRFPAALGYPLIGVLATFGTFITALAAFRKTRRK